MVACLCRLGGLGKDLAVVYSAQGSKDQSQGWDLPLLTDVGDVQEETMTMIKLRVVTGLLALWLSSIAMADTQELWIDVRSADEYSAGHIPGHANIPHGEITLRISELTTDKNTPIQLYCRSGRRSGIAVELLQQEGFTNVRNVGGIDDAKAKLAAAEDCSKGSAC